jgi:Glutathione peroxidase
MQSVWPTGAEIASFCKLTYDVTFSLFSKIEVNGSKSHPLFQWLKKEAKVGDRRCKQAEHRDIECDDALLLPNPANPAGSNFRERHRRRAPCGREVDVNVCRDTEDEMAAAAAVT